MTSDVLVWWLSSSDVRTLVASSFIRYPSWLVSEVQSALGREGRGRLWINSRFSGQHVTIDPWPETPLGQHASRCAGIVITKDDLHYLKHLPGMVTTLKLTRIESPP
jgi:hypothetical protein